VLSRPVAQFLGKISFSLYLIHGPMICSLMSSLIVLIYHLHPSPGLATFAAAAITVPISLALSWLLFRLVDRPALRLSARIGHVIDVRAKSIAAAPSWLHPFSKGSGMPGGSA
jgi:peptidoglycan/LPS O-acetylase OafA/YrhL